MIENQSLDITPARICETPEELWWYVNNFIPLLKDNKPDLYNRNIQGDDNDTF